MNCDFLITNGVVVTGDSTCDADVAVNDGRIAAIVPPHSAIDAREILDNEGCYVIPGAIDAHVHLNMQTGVGYTADDWRTGTIAAALGGVTALVDFVETEPDESLLDALHKRLAETREAVIDFGLHMTIQPDEHPINGVPRRVSDKRIGQIREAYEAGCATFKLYMAYPGFQVQDIDLFRALRAISAVNGLACIHAENGDVIEVLRQSDIRNPALALNHARTRPSINEHEAVTRAVMCAEASGARVLIFHIGCEHAARVVADARQRGLSNVFGETCPQYLLLTEEMLARPDGRLWVCAPPLRPQANQDALWRMLASRALDIVSTDHCPFTRQQKDTGRDDFRLAPGGLPGIETRLGVLHEYGVRRGRLSGSRSLSLNDWVRICCTRPAEIHGLSRKGRIAVGYDADLVVFDPAQRKPLTARDLHSAIDWSAYDGIECTGWPRDVIARGEVVVRGGRFVGASGRGRFIKRSSP
ncbi:MAG: dihydropyrimidinase [Chloroflexi bacterium]|nr:dihydropyrimidinase [Chloroflexota bacterium]